MPLKKANTIVQHTDYGHTDYGHTMAKSPNALGPKFKSQSQINIRGVDIKAYFFVEIMVD
jgi:hypothetical protein